MIYLINLSHLTSMYIKTTIGSRVIVLVISFQPELLEPFAILISMYLVFRVLLWFFTFSVVKLVLNLALTARSYHI